MAVDFLSLIENFLLDLILFACNNNLLTDTVSQIILPLADIPSDKVSIFMNFHATLSLFFVIFEKPNIFEFSLRRVVSFDCKPMFYIRAPFTLVAVVDAD